MLGGRPIRILDAIAPRSGWGAGLRAVLALVLIDVAHLGIRAALGQPLFHLRLEVVVTTVVALPFVLSVMAVLLHQHRLQQMLRIHATTDMLTGLPNRRDFMARARAALDQAGGGVLLLLDADHFKRINDRWGHGIGDACLAAIADRLHRRLRTGAVLGRLGGEEFAAFLPAATPDEARVLGESLCRPIQVGHAAPGLSLTVSAGMAVAGAGVPFERLMARADHALYQAKAEGRARLAVWSQDRTRAA